MLKAKDNPYYMLIIYEIKTPIFRIFLLFPVRNRACSTSQNPKEKLGAYIVENSVASPGAPTLIFDTLTGDRSEW